MGLINFNKRANNEMISYSNEPISSHRKYTLPAKSAGKNSNTGKRHEIWKNFAMSELMTSIVQENCQVIERLTEKIWGRG